MAVTVPLFTTYCPSDPVDFGANLRKHGNSGVANAT